VLLELVVPRMDGRQLLGAMRGDGALAAIPVVLVTGTPPSDLRAEVRAALKNPVWIDDLLACVRAYEDPAAALRSAGAALS
jgi:CheY-like chemotaxis protein